MDNTGFAVKCKGTSHALNGLPCQDSAHYIKKPGIISAAVADGHGSKQYFRSEVGSQFASEIACEKMAEFLRMTDLTPDDKIPTKQSIIRLIESIVTEWRISVKEHILDSPFTDDEMENVSNQYKEIYIPFSYGKINNYTPYELETLLRPEDSAILKAYGSTLIVIGMCEEYGIGLHIGDGKCVAFYDDGSSDEPIPWDDRCHLNKCTSICDENSVSEFRYHIWKDKLPVAVFAGSDGLDDSFADKLHMFYRKIVLDFINSDFHLQVMMLEKLLPQISERGSKDDISIIGIVDLEKIAKIANILSSVSENAIVQDRIKELTRKLEELNFRYVNTEKLYNKCSDTDAEKKEKYRFTLEKIRKEIDIIKSDIGEENE